MAATNYTPIQLYFSTTASAVPLAANLAQGELAINITDGKLYYEDNGGVVQVIATKGAGTIGGSTTQIQYNNAGALAGNAAMTFNSGTSTTTLTTLNLTNALGAIYGGTAQSAYTQGDFLYASATNTLSKLGIGTVNYILTSTGSVPQWVAPSSVTVNTATNLAGGAAGSVPYQSGVATTTFLAIGAANTVMTSSGTAPQWGTTLTGLTGLSTSSFTNTSLTSGRVRLSTTGGLEADSANLTFNGTTLSTTGLSNTGVSTLVKTLTLGDSNFNGTAVFAAATPAKLYIGTGTVTDVTSAISATNTTGAISSLAITPIAATNTSVTYTNASTLYIAGAPSAGTNVTITNPYALYVAAGASYLNSLSLGTVLPTTSGGTGLTSFTANGVVYASSTSALATGSALTFDGSNLGVGVSPTQTLNVKGIGLFEGTAQGNLIIQKTGTNGVSLFSDAAGTLGFYDQNAGATRMSLTSSGLEIKQSQLIGYSSYAGIGTNGLAVAGNVGIGTSSPAYKLDVSGSANITSFLRVGATPATGGDIRLPNTGIIAGRNAANSSNRVMLQLDSSDSVLLQEGSVVINPAGNLGLGVTPSAWLSSYKAFQIGSVGRSLAQTGAGAGDWTMAFNAIYSASNSRWDYAYTGDAAVRYSQAGTGIHAWYTSGSSAGTAGNLVSFTQAMTLDTSANLLVGTTTAIGKFTAQQSTDSTTGGIAIISVDGNGAVISRLNDGGLTFRNGGAERARIDSSGNLIQTVNTTAATLTTNQTLTFSIVNDSLLRISVRGSDGTTRTATLALT